MKKDYSSLAKALAVVALLSIMIGGFLIARRKNQGVAPLQFRDVCRSCEKRLFILSGGFR